jgi:hypothetical protein
MHCGVLRGNVGDVGLGDILGLLQDIKTQSAAHHSSKIVLGRRPNKHQCMPRPVHLYHHGGRLLEDVARLR